MREPVRTSTYETVPLGELVMAAFDVAAQYSADPQEISRLATSSVTHLLRCAGDRDPGAGVHRKSAS